MSAELAVFLLVALVAAVVLYQHGQRLTMMESAMSQLDDKIEAINQFTNDLAAEADATAAEVAALRASLAAAPTVTQATLDKLDAIGASLGATSAKLKATAADPANPVPAPAPATP